MRYDAKTGQVVVMAGFGRTSDWYQNIQAHPAKELVIGRRSFVPTYRELPKDEAAAVLADYDRRNRIAAPIIRGTLSRLIGWRYDGYASCLRRV